MPGLVITTLLVDGEPEGLRVMQLTGANVRGTFFPRAGLPRFLQVRREDAGKPGVYILFLGAEAGDLDERVYIGEGENVGYRLNSHDKEKDFWSHAVVFTSTDKFLTKTEIKFLESSLIADAKAAARAVLENGTVPSLPNVPETSRVPVESFLGNMRILLGAAGIQLLRPRSGRMETRSDQPFALKAKGAQATMVRTTTGYVVKIGSTAAADVARSIRSSSRAARERLIAAGILIADRPGLLRFTADYEFESPSGAAAVICGREASGPKSWKLPDGRTLEHVEESETSDQAPTP